MDPSDSRAEARYERERDFHDGRFGDNDDARAAARRFYGLDASIGRYRSLLSEIPAGARVLEYGCGPGSEAFSLGARSVDVLGIDISPAAITAAREQAAADGLVTVAFEEMNAEALSLEPSTFDYVVGSGVLHHLDLARAYDEIMRVLRPGGTAVFYEPLGMNPLINLYRRLTPKMRTPDEHPIVLADLAAARERGFVVHAEYFNLVALLRVLTGRLPGGSWFQQVFERIDQLLFRVVPFSRRFAWILVLRLVAPPAGESR